MAQQSSQAPSTAANHRHGSAAVRGDPVPFREHEYNAACRWEPISTATKPAGSTATTPRNWPTSNAAAHQHGCRQARAATYSSPTRATGSPPRRENFKDIRFHFTSSSKTQKAAEPPGRLCLYRFSDFHRNLDNQHLGVLGLDPKNRPASDNMPSRGSEFRRHLTRPRPRRCRLRRRGGSSGTGSHARSARGPA